MPQSPLRRQKPSLGSREHKVRGRVPFFLVVILPSFMVWMLLRLHDKLNAFVGVTHKTSEQPKQHADHQDDCFLSSSEVSKKDIDKRDHATSYAYIEPP